MFLPSYTVFGTEAHTTTRVWASVFVNEQKVYAYIKKKATPLGWRYFRIDTVDQCGFPDILLLRGPEYWVIEAKLLRKAKLVVIEDDLKWQFGQLGFMQRSLVKYENYMLVVGKDNTIAFIKGGCKDGTVSYPDFVK